MKLFEILYINNARKSAYIFAKKQGDFDFEINEKSKLGKIELKPILSQPRALKKDGSPDLSIFAFCPKDRGQLKDINVGNVLELK
jgi:hypothetical protein